MRILITAGPTREYLDDVRYLSNASSGRMGYALAESAAQHGHQVTLVSGPVALAAPQHAAFIPVTTAQEMYEACVERFQQCEGVIAVAAVCDYRPPRRSAGKIKKSGQPLLLELVETVDILAELGRRKTHQWLVGFAMETGAAVRGALHKLRTKNCDAMVLNAPSAMGAEVTEVQLIHRSGQVVRQLSGTKPAVADALLDWIERELLPPQRAREP